MKIGKGRASSGDAAGLTRGSGAKLNKMSKNNSKRNLYILLTVLITALLIVWVYSMGRKAEETVQVCMTKQAIYKNQVITESMLMPYDMLKGEFEKFATVNSSGQKTRRILLWDERKTILNSFAAYPLQANNYCEYRNFIKSRISNKDSVLYSFPGKDVVPFEVGEAELNTFKTFIQPGDRVNITAIYSQEEEIERENEFGEIETETEEVIRVEPAFTDIMIADILNQSGDSVLDIYADYNDRTAYQQAQLDASSQFQDSVEPTSLLVALTPAEKERYFYYVAKGNCEFRMTLPQRIE